MYSIFKGEIVMTNDPLSISAAFALRFQWSNERGISGRPEGVATLKV